MLVGNQDFELVLGTCLFVYDSFYLFEGALDHSRLISVLLGELNICEIVHLLLNEHHDLVDLLYQIHLFNHLTFFYLLDVHLLLYLPDLSLLVQLDFTVSIDLLRLPPFLAIELQQEQLSQCFCPLFNLIVAWELSG